MAFRVAAAAFFLCLNVWIAQTKIYDRCELARELRDVHEFPEHQLATWLCIANYESHFNTSAHNPGSGDHGIFQISQLYWCSPPGDGFACGLPCDALKDDDIEDDAICARRIYRQHQRMSGDGFTAWVVYNLHCRNPVHAASFLEGCFDEENLVKYGYQPIYAAMNLPTIIVPMPSIPPSPPTVMMSIPSLPPSPPLFVSTIPVVVSPLPSPRTSTPSPTIKPPPRKTSTTYPKVEFKSTTKVPHKPFTTQKPPISTYKPLLNLSTRFSSAQFISSTVKPSVPSSMYQSFTNKPKLSTTQFGFVTNPKVNKASTYKPVSTIFRVSPEVSVKSGKISTYRPMSSTIRTTHATTLKVTTPRPQISTYKPFLNRISSFERSGKSTQRPNAISLTSPVTTPRPSTVFSTYKPFLNQYSSRIYSTTKKQILSSGFTSSPFTSSKLFINSDGPGKTAVVKPRETKNAFPGVNPFQFKRNETVYAFVSNPGYSFAISSSGFKFVRTAN